MNDAGKIRETVTKALAVVGFVALVGAGVWLAAYSARFVPSAVNSAGEAAVYLGSAFTRAPAETPDAAVPAPAASTTIQLGGEPVPAPAASPTPAAYTQTAPAAGRKTTSAYPIDGAAPLSGLPDLAVDIDAIGYLATNSAESFIPSSTVPAGARPAIRFIIENRGTNVTGPWRWSAFIPTTSNSLFQSLPQQALNPGDYIEYVFGFDQAIPGADRLISITANFDRAVAESDMNNNSDFVKITVLGN